MRSLRYLPLENHLNGYGTWNRIPSPVSVVFVILSLIWLEYRKRQANGAGEQ